MVPGKWSFFAVVLDGVANQGLIQLDYAYGYNNGSVDLKVKKNYKVENEVLKGFQMKLDTLIRQKFDLSNIIVQLDNQTLPRLCKNVKQKRFVICHQLIYSVFFN